MILEQLSIIQILAILSASAAGGMRIGLPLLIIGLVYVDRLWSDIPILSSFPPQVIVAVLTAWSLFELIGTKQLIGFRILQIIQLVFSPVVGAVMAIGVARLMEVQLVPFWILGTVGALVAFVLKLVQVGWFFRLGKIPLSLIFVQDFLSAILVIFALEAPRNGGLIAMCLLWLALRSSSDWKYNFKKKTFNGLKKLGFG